MKRVIATSTIPGDLGEKMRAAARAGFQGIAIVENDLLYFDRKPAQVRRLAEDLGLAIVALQPFRDYEGLPEPLRQKALARAERKFQLMGELGARLLVVSSNTAAETSDDPARAIADLAELADRAAGHGLAIGYEAVAWGRRVTDARAAWALVRSAARENLGLVLDALQVLYRGPQGLEDLRGIPAEKIVLVQLADAPALHLGPQELSQHFRCFPGQGDYPVVELMRRIREAGYRGMVSLAITNDELRSASPHQMAVDGARSLAWLEAQLEAQPVTAGSPPAAPALVSGIEFIEFATAGGEAAWLAQALESFGFRKTHLHRSKAVSLYRQGDINFILNTEPDSLAHSYYEVHGTSVCALGLGTQRQTALLAQSQRCGCEAFHGRVSPGELAIPAIRGVGGSLLYFVERQAGAERFFEVDFQRVLNEEPTGYGLRRIDHVAQAVAPTEFLSAQLFYRAVLDLEPAAQHDILDPHGIVCSRTMESRDHGLRIALNASHARDSSTQRFRTRFAGSGIQHIALSCNDAFAVAERLNRVNILPIADSYYDELEGRFSLDAALLERMRSLKVLYDEDQNGRYFHIYTRQVNGLFFELVQRDGYDRFGEANAPARLAAQALEYERMRDVVEGFEPPQVL